MYIKHTSHKFIKYNLKRLCNVSETSRKKEFVWKIILECSIKCF